MNPSELPQPLQGKTALVTGASRGIGKSIALKLASLGANTLINYNSDQEAAKNVQKMITSYGVRSGIFQGDVSQSTDIDNMFDAAESEFGQISILINNAGIVNDRLILRMTEKQWDDVINVDLKGPFLCTKRAVRSMSKSRWGRIVNISSVVALGGNVGQSNYAAAKSGLSGFTMSVAKEFASRNVTANVVAPGYISTDVTEKLSKDVQESIISRIPMKRPGTPEDVSNLVGFLCTEEASYITGQFFTVDGGMTLS